MVNKPSMIMIFCAKKKIMSVKSHIYVTGYRQGVAVGQAQRPSDSESPDSESEWGPGRPVLTLAGEPAGPRRVGPGLLVPLRGQ
jgi:hypothetical protein